MASDKSTSDYHTEGQRDGAAGAWPKDHNPGLSNLLDTKESFAEKIENAEAYKAGYENGYKQR